MEISLLIEGNFGKGLNFFSSLYKDIIRSRLIGTKGKTRKSIEEHTKCFMSVYGNTVALIGDYSQIEKARHAIEMIMRGSPHGKVYNYLETL